MVAHKVHYPKIFNGTMELIFDVPNYTAVGNEYALANRALSVM